MIPDSFLALLINSTPWCSWACERENKREGRGRTYREEGRNRLFKTTLLSKSSLQRGHLLPMVGGILFLQQLNKLKFVLHQLFGDSQVPQFTQVHCEPIFWLNQSKPRWICESCENESKEFQQKWLKERTSWMPNFCSMEFSNPCASFVSPAFRATTLGYSSLLRRTSLVREDWSLRIAEYLRWNRVFSKCKQPLVTYIQRRYI